MKMLCISTFGEFGQIKNLTFNKIYECKFYDSDKLLVLDDKGKPKFCNRQNFVNWEKIKDFQHVFNPK